MENTVKKINTILFKQIENESTQSFLWLLFSINRSLVHNPQMTLSEFQGSIKEACPEFFDWYLHVMKTKDLKTVG
jgi:hypothetical protein